MSDVNKQISLLLLQFSRH